MTCVSFADDGASLGVVLLEGEHTPETAARLTAFANINPGGSLIVSYMPADVSDEEYETSRRYMNRLLTPEQVFSLFPRAEYLLLRKSA